jgi:hypothetical protein
MPNARVMYVNGELESVPLNQIVQPLAALGMTPADTPRRRFRFENYTALSELGLKFDATGLDELTRIDAMLAAFWPDIVYLDTACAVLDIDEVDTKQVVAAFKTYAAKYKAAAVCRYSTLTSSASLVSAGIDSAMARSPARVER